MAKHDSIAIVIMFSKNLDASIAAAIARGEIKGKAELMANLAKAFKGHLHMLVDPLKQIDKGVSVKIVITGD